ncbi:MAG: amidohydrolase [Prolixibacteraceae bacterium]
MENNSEILNLALVQMDLVWENRDENLTQISALLEKMKQQPDVIVLPETFASGFSMNAQKVAETMDGRTVEWMKETARNHQLAVCGSVFIEENGSYYNRFIWVNPGSEVFTYNKRHLFSMGKEDSVYTKGEEQTLISYKGWLIFPQICYDVRFPVWSRNTHFYDILLNVANWPAPRRKVWKTLLKARAIENQCYVLGVNRLGRDGNGINYSGDSLIVSPKGELLGNAKDNAEILFAELNRTTLHAFRKKFDTLKDADQFQIQA